MILPSALLHGLRFCYMSVRYSLFLPKLVIRSHYQITPKQFIHLFLYIYFGLIIFCQVLIK